MSFPQLSPSLGILILLLVAAPTEAAPVAVLPAEFEGAVQPQVAVAPSGMIHVTFGKESSVYHVASKDGGRTFSEPVQVGELSKFALGMRRGPRIAATNQVVAITAISHEKGDVQSWNSTDGGASWNAGANINDVPKSAREGLHAMAGSGQGSVLVTWLDLRNKGTELWSATSSDGGINWGANTLVYRSPDGHICECCHPSAAMDGHDRAAVMWRNWLGGSRDMYAALSADGGKTFAAAQKLGTGTWKLEGCPMDGGSIALVPGGKMLTAWRREKTAFATENKGPEQRLSDSALQPAVIAGKKGAFHLWENDGGLMLKKGSASPARFAEKAAFASGASTPAGGAVIIWESAATGPKTLLASSID